jgi:hypothetical protein
LSWGASSGATSYSVCYNTSATCSAWISVGTATTKTLSGLNPNTTYYWHVKASNANGTTYATGIWWSFTTAAFPAPFNKTAPTNAAPGQPANPTLSWAASSGATKYYFCYNTSKTCVTWLIAGSATSKALSGLNPNTTYYWHVKASNAAGTTYSTGGWWSFTTGDFPGPFNKTAPANGAIGQSLNPTLTWAASSGATNYLVCYNTSAACVTWVSTGSATSKALSGLNPNTTYYWHVKAGNATGAKFANGGWWSFTTTP